MYAKKERKGLSFFVWLGAEIFVYVPFCIFWVGVKVENTRLSFANSLIRWRDKEQAARLVETKRGKARTFESLKA